MVHVRGVLVLLILVLSFVAGANKSRAAFCRTMLKSSFISRLAAGTTDWEKQTFAKRVLELAQTKSDLKDLASAVENNSVRFLAVLDGRREILRFFQDVPQVHSPRRSRLFQAGELVVWTLIFQYLYKAIVGTEYIMGDLVYWGTWLPFIGGVLLYQARRSQNVAEDEAIRKISEIVDKDLYLDDEWMFFRRRIAGGHGALLLTKENDDYSLYIAAW